MERIVLKKPREYKRSVSKISDTVVSDILCNNCGKSQKGKEYMWRCIICKDRYVICEMCCAKNLFSKNKHACEEYTNL